MLFPNTYSFRSSASTGVASEAHDVLVVLESTESAYQEVVTDIFVQRSSARGGQAAAGEDLRHIDRCQNNRFDRVQFLLAHRGQVLRLQHDLAARERERVEQLQALIQNLAV